MMDLGNLWDLLRGFPIGFLMGILVTFLVVVAGGVYVGFTLLATMTGASRLEVIDALQNAVQVMKDKRDHGAKVTLMELGEHCVNALLKLRAKHMGRSTAPRTRGPKPPPPPPSNSPAKRQPEAVGANLRALSRKMED